MSTKKRRPSFAPRQTFGAAIKAIEKDYFKDTSNKKSKRGDWRLWHKSAILLPLFVMAYSVLVFTDINIWTKCILLVLVLAPTTASIGFNIGHDANHESFSEKKWVNDLFSLSFNLVGVDYFGWRTKHNVLHHTFTNIKGADDDVNAPGLRFHEGQPWKPIHRYQWFYCWFLYSLLFIGWIVQNDLKKYLKRRINGYEWKIEKKNWLILIFTKIFHFSFFWIIPIIFLGWKQFLVGYIAYTLIVGLTTAIVFQMAHIVEKVTQPTFVEGTPLEEEWIEHEVATTADFAPDNKVLSWFVGGLNFQIEHHLFPKVSHIHYKALSIEVQKVCKEYGKPYNVYPTFRSAITSHFRKMKELSKKPVL